MLNNKGKRTKSSTASIGILILATVLSLPFAGWAQGTGTIKTGTTDDSDARPPVTKADLQITERARQILDSPSKWNRNDNRECPVGAKTFSLYCAFEAATSEAKGNSEHRGAALQEARFVIDEIAVARNYDHRLMDYNNDPATTFADIQEIFSITEKLLALRLKVDSSSPAAKPAKPAISSPGSPAQTSVTASDIEIIKRARQIIDSPTKWDRHDTQDCKADATTFSLYCALIKAATEVNNSSDRSLAVHEVRTAIDETPNHKSYSSRLTDFNNDPTVTFADLQKLLQLVEERLTKRLAENVSK